MVGGADPVDIVNRYVTRVVHVHLKDVDAALAQQVLSGHTTFGDAVAGGLFRPLGQGDVAIDSMVKVLERSGYRGWYVLEQDLKLSVEPEGEGPAENVRTSFEYLVQVAQ
jgi:inosose dehydratase